MTRIDFSIAARDTILLWTQILAAWYTAAIIGNLAAQIICGAIVGNRYYSLYIIGHDGLHRRIHSNKSVNDWWTNIFLIGPLGAVVRINRNNHMEHHKRLNLSGDPDRYKYQSRSGTSITKFLYSLTGLNFVLRALMNVYTKKNSKKNQHAARHNITELITIASIQISLVGTLTHAFGPWGYVTMWLIPVYIFTFCADMIRVYCEHSVDSDTADASLASRMPTYKSTIIERIILSPMNMNHHAAHHLWPSIPYYKLPVATELAIHRVRMQCPDAPPIEFKGRYIDHLCRHACNKPKQSEK